MKLQRQKTRKDKNYYKHVVVIPDGFITEAGFKEGDELEAEAKKGEIILKKKK
jgi:bifunctional DNA-binding transcriptional regulator/antitoxin component of YhaV-PrlF toxin-antitoxin module